MTLRWTGIVGFIGLLAGCTASQGPEVVAVSPAQYDEAFSTSVAMVRARGWEPELMDRRSGVIETAPVQAGSVFEPWHLNTTDMSTIVENSISHTRTRARIEFRPANAARLAKSQRDDLRPPDYLGLEDMGDLTQATGPLDLRAWVYIEHGHTPNVMMSTWTPGLKARPRRVGHDSNWESPPSGVVWITSSRDRGAERRLLGAIERALQTDQPLQIDPPSPAG